MQESSESIGLRGRKRPSKSSPHREILSIRREEKIFHTSSGAVPYMEKKRSMRSGRGGKEFIAGPVYYTKKKKKTECSSRWRGRERRGKRSFFLWNFSAIEGAKGFQIHRNLLGGRGGVKKGGREEDRFLEYGLRSSKE